MKIGFHRLLTSTENQPSSPDIKLRSSFHKSKNFPKQQNWKEPTFTKLKTNLLHLLLIFCVSAGVFQSSYYNIRTLSTISCTSHISFKILTISAL